MSVPFDLTAAGTCAAIDAFAPVDPDVVGPELEEDEIRMLPRKFCLVFHQEAQVLPRGVSAPAVVDHPGPYPICIQHFLKKMGVGGRGDAVARAENDDSPNRGGAKGDEQRNEDHGRDSSTPDIHVF